MAKRFLQRNCKDNTNKHTCEQESGNADISFTRNMISLSVTVRGRNSADVICSDGNLALPKRKLSISF